MEALLESAGACKNPVHDLGTSCSLSHISFFLQRGVSVNVMTVLVLYVVKLHPMISGISEMLMMAVLKFGARRPELFCSLSLCSLIPRFRIGTELQKWTCLDILLGSWLKVALLEQGGWTR